MKQNSNEKKDAAIYAKTDASGKAITADRAGKSEQAASRKQLGKLKKLFEAWLDARASGAAEELLESGSEWQKLLQAAGLSIIDGRQDVASDARAAAEKVAARYNAAKTETARKALPIVVDVITQDGMQPVPVAEAMQPLLATVDPAQVWSAYDSNVRTVATRKCQLADVLPFVSARGVLTVSEIAARLPEERRKGAAEIQRKVESVLLAKSKAYAAFSASDLQAVKTRGASIVHVLNVKYDEGAAARVK